MSLGIHSYRGETYFNSSFRPTRVRILDYGTATIVEISFIFQCHSFHTVHWTKTSPGNPSLDAGLVWDATPGHTIPSVPYSHVEGEASMKGTLEAWQKLESRFIQRQEGMERAPLERPPRVWMTFLHRGGM